RVGITLKGIDGVLETIVGVLLLVNPGALRNLSLTLWTYGHFGDPSHFEHSHLGRLAHTDPTFAAMYLLTHGLAKVVIVIALWMNRLWAYPVAIFVFAAFTLYQLFRVAHTHSVGLILLTIFDIAIVYLTWMEYQEQKRLREFAAT